MNAEASLARHMKWLYGEGGVYGGAGTPCLCDHRWLPLGLLHDIRMGKGWVRMNTHPECAHHGDNRPPLRRGRHARLNVVEDRP